MRIALIVAAHNEGAILGTTLLSLMRMIDSLQHAVDEVFWQSCQFEFIVVRDRADEPTRIASDSFARYIQDSPSAQKIRYRVLNTDFGEPGSARNAAISASQSDYLLVMDGDDLICSSFLREAVSFIQAQEQPNALKVLHPNYLFTFDEKLLLLQQPSWNSFAGNKTSALLINPWDVTVFAPRSVYESCHYLSTAVSQGTGFEDWEWNLATLTRGIEHHVLPKTTVYKRSKPFGRLIRDNLGHVLVETSRINWNFFEA